MTKIITIEQSAGLLAKQLLGQFIQLQQPFCAGVEGQMIHVNENTSFLDLKNEIIAIFEENSSFELSKEQHSILKNKLQAIQEDSFTLTLLEIESEQDFEEIMVELQEIHEEILDTLDEYQEVDGDSDIQDNQEENNNPCLIDLLMNIKDKGLEGLLKETVENFSSKENQTSSPTGCFGTVSSENKEIETKAKEIFYNTLKEVTNGKLHPFEATEAFLQNLKVLGKDIEVNFFS